MAGSVVVGDVVFRKGEGDGSDIWDDTALIEAYDNAISIVKSKLVERGSLSEGSQDTQAAAQGQKKHKKNRRKHKKDKTKNSNRHGKHAQELQWKAGDHCRAVFTEDGGLYEAVIRSADNTAGTCVVRYLGYGNEEEQALTDLLPSEARGGQTSAQQSDVGSEIGMETDDLDWVGTPPRPSRSAHSPRAQGHLTAQPRPSVPTTEWASYGAMSSPFSAYTAAMAGMPPPPLPPMPFMPGTMPAFPTMPSFPMPPFTMPSSSSAHTSHNLHIPEMPAPPPLVGDEEELVSDKEALHSMLVSWYMSGYHTGYYQGLKQAKKHSGAPSSSGSGAAVPPEQASAPKGQQPKSADKSPPMPERR